MTRRLHHADEHRHNRKHYCCCNAQPTRKRSRAKHQQDIYEPQLDKRTHTLACNPPNGKRGRTHVRTPHSKGQVSKHTVKESSQPVLQACIQQAAAPVLLRRTKTATPLHYRLMREKIRGGERIQLSQQPQMETRIVATTSGLAKAECWSLPIPSFAMSRGFAVAEFSPDPEKSACWFWPPSMGFDLVCCIMQFSRG